MDAMFDYMKEELAAQKKEEDELVTPDEMRAMKEQLQAAVDPNGDKKITLDKLKAGITTCVDKTDYSENA